MRLVITGASGFIAQELVPLFLQRGIDPILISARCQPLRERFPGLVCDSYDNLQRHLAGADGVTGVCGFGAGVKFAPSTAL